jgi:hypothetical protein
MESLTLFAVIFIVGFIFGYAVKSILGKGEKNPPSLNEHDYPTHEALSLFGSPELAPLFADPKVIAELSHLNTALLASAEAQMVQPGLDPEVIAELSHLNTDLLAYAEAQMVQPGLDPEVIAELLKAVSPVTDLEVPIEPFDWGAFLKAEGFDPDVYLLAGTELILGDIDLGVIAGLLKAVAVVTDPEVTGEFLKAVAVVTDPEVIAELLRAVTVVTDPELKAELLKALAVVTDPELKAELLKAVAVVTAQR